MYWQKRLDRTASTQIIEEEIQAIRKKHQHYGYRSITQELKRRGFQVNKKKVQRLIQKLKLLRNPENIIPIKESLVKSLKI